LRLQDCRRGHDGREHTRIDHGMALLDRNARRAYTIRVRPINTADAGASD
jgi:hypothetical protein